MESVFEVTSAGGSEDLVILTAGKPFQYLLPHFEILAVNLRKIEIERVFDEETLKFDAFIRSDSNFNMNCPVLVSVIDSFIIEPAVFSRCMKIDHLQLPPEGVYVLWKWKLNDDYFIDEESQCICEDETTLSQHTPEEEEDTTACKSDEEKNIGNHTVTFKCIGANKSADSQQCLKRVSELLASGIDVIVDIYPEPENAFDSRAIAFKAYVDNKLHTIGYVVREATEAVHDGITKKEITNVKFAWARYLLSWSRSGPGYYAGIDITIRGRWPVSVVQCASTQ